MGCGESKLAIATAEGVLNRKKSSPGRCKSGCKQTDGSKSSADTAVADLKVADSAARIESENKTEQQEEKKIDDSVKIESENKVEQREEKKIDDAVKIELEDKTKQREEKKVDGTVKMESEEKSGSVVGTEGVKIEGIKEKEVTGDSEKKGKEEGETKVEKEKEAGVNGSEIVVEEKIKAVEEKPLAGEVEKGIKSVEEMQLAGGTKTEKKEGGDNGGPVEKGIKSAEEKQLAEVPNAQKQNGEAVKLKEETQSKKEDAAPKVEETQSSATPLEGNNVKDPKESGGDLGVKDITAEEKK